MADALVRADDGSGRLAALMQLGLGLIQQTDPATTLQSLFDAAGRTVPSHCLMLAMSDRRVPQRYRRLARGAGPAPYADADPSGLLPGLAARVVAERRPLRGHASLPPGDLPWAAGPFLGVPLNGRKGCHGVLLFTNPPGGESFTEEDEGLALALATAGAVAYENGLLNDDLQRQAASLQLEVTERRRAEQALAAREARFRSMIEHVSDVITLTRADGVLMYVSPSVKAMGGYEPEELVGRSFLELLHPDDLDRATRVMREILASPGVPVRAELRYRHKNGSWLYVETVSKNALDDPDIGGMVVNAHDVTERKRAEAAITETAASLARAQEYARLGSWEFTVATESGRWSAQMFELLRRDPALGAPTFAGFMELVHPQDRPRIEQAHQRSVETGAPSSVEFRSNPAHGAVRYFSGGVHTAVTADGKVVELRGTLQDITERKLHERAMRRSNRVYAVLSGINAAIVRSRNRQQLFEDACRIAVEKGGFGVAWIGVVEGDALKPAAWHGEGAGRLKDVRFSLKSDGPNGNVPTARAVREGRAVVCNDIAGDATLGPWRGVMLALRAEALLAHPLVVDGRVVGCLTLYAGRRDFFDEAEMKVLADVAANLAYAMEFIAREERLGYLTSYDALTGLANRALFGERLAELVATARQDGQCLAVMVADIERFKLVNDSLGMAAGDDLLKAVARRLVALCGPQMVARIGGDRFAAVLPGASDMAQVAGDLLPRARRCVTDAVQVGGHELSASAKLGIAIFPAHGTEADSLFRNAEGALNQAKQTGERELFYTQQMSAASRARLGLESQLRRALDHDEFLLHYQPKVDAQTGAICGCEALIRWRSPDLGLMAPARFVPLLEESGMILEVGRWAMHQALADHRRWRQQGLAAPRVAVNVSPLQLRQRDFVDVVRAALGRDAGAAGGLEIEITESLLMTGIEQHIEKLKALRALHVPVAIDDFGTGYSSLAYLARLPISAVKVDRSFTSGMNLSPDTMNIVAAIVSLAHSMSLKVVAEGVENLEQLKFLRLLRCDEIQGYLFSKPLPADEFARLLHEGRRLAA